MDGNPLGFGLLHQLGKLAIGSLNEQSLKRSAAPAQRFANGMQSVQQFRPVIVSSGWCRRACLR